MVWTKIGSVTVGPFDSEVTIGPINVPPQNGVELWVQQVSPPSSWNYGYGLLWAENSNGRFIGTIKVYGHPEGEAYRLGDGLSSSIGTGVLKFSPRAYNLRWIEASNETWSLDFYVLDSEIPPVSSTINRPSIVFPVSGSGELVTPRSDAITGYNNSIPLLIFASDKDLKVFKPQDTIEQDSGHTPTTSPVTKVESISTTYSCCFLQTGNIIAGTPENIYDGSFTPTSTNNKIITNGGEGLLETLFDPPIMVESSLQIIGYITSSSPVYCVVNGQIIRSNELTDDGGGFLTLPFTGLLTSVGVGIDPSNGGFANVYWSAVYVDGTRLVDGAPITKLTLTDDTDLLNFRIGDPVNNGAQIKGIKDVALGAPFELTVDGGSFNISDVVTGPATTPATGAIASVDPINKNIVLMVSDQTFPKRWIVNQGKTVIGQERMSPNDPPDAQGLTIRSSAFASTPPNSLTQTSSDWQITLQGDTGYQTPIDTSTATSVNLQTWTPSGITGATDYRCRVRHRSDSVTSDWSADCVFKTA